MNFGVESFGSVLAMSAICGTVFGVVIRGWNSVRTWTKNCIGMFVREAGIEDATLFKSVLAYLIETHPYSKVGMVFSGAHCNLRDGAFEFVPFESFVNRTFMFWNGWIPFWLKIHSSEKDNTPQPYGSSRPATKLGIVFFRWMLDPEKIVKAAAIKRNQMYGDLRTGSKKRFFINKIPGCSEDGTRRYAADTCVEWYHEGTTRLIAHDVSQLGRSPVDNKASSNNLYFPAKVMKILKECRAWHDLKDWYIKRGIPWKRGLLLFGPPGTGKTAMVRAMAEELDMPLFVYALGQMMDHDLEASWKAMQAHTPCFALFEDFDTVFNGRVNVYGKASISDQIEAAAMKKDDNSPADSGPGLLSGKLSFGCLLNVLDGVDKTNGIFTIITTNHIEKLDPALGVPKQNADGTIDFISSRPGRIDKAVELTYMENGDKAKLARRIFEDDEDGYHQIMKDLDREKETPAQFQERCAQLALESLWDKKQREVEIQIAADSDADILIEAEAA